MLAVITTNICWVLTIYQALLWAFYMCSIMESFQQPYDTFSIIIPILLMRKLRHRKAKTLVLGITAGKGGWQISDLGVCATEHSMWFMGVGEPERRPSPGCVRNKEQQRLCPRDQTCSNWCSVTICQETGTMEQWSQMTSQMFSNSEILWSWHKLHPAF